MLTPRARKHLLLYCLAVGFVVASAAGQTTQQPAAPTHANVLRGEVRPHLEANRVLAADEFLLRIDADIEMIETRLSGLMSGDLENSMSSRCGRASDSVPLRRHGQN